MQVWTVLNYTAFFKQRVMYNFFGFEGCTILKLILEEDTLRYTLTRMLYYNLQYVRFLIPFKVLFEWCE